MKVLGNVDFAYNQLQNIVLEPVDNFPTNPKLGSFIFKDKRAMICVEIENVPVWVPLTNELNTHVHTQTVASSTWVIDHNLNTSFSVVNIIDVSGSHIIPDSIEQIYNQTLVTFSSPQLGKALLVIGDSNGIGRASVSYTQDFLDPSTEWVVSHGLGYEPIIRVFIGNNEVQPLSITHDTLNQATVRFTNPQTGKIRAI